MNNNSNDKHVVAVFGALGYTARFVIQELLNRNITIIAVARNLEALKKAYGTNPNVVIRHATVDDAKQLDEAFSGASVVVNCAGPFSTSAVPVVEAALRSGAHYIDTSAEQHPVSHLYERFDTKAKEKNVAIMPALGIFGGYGDLMVSALMGNWKSADLIQSMLGYDSWSTTRGSKNTVAAIGVDERPPMNIREGKLSPFAFSDKTITHSFAEPIGTHEMLECPLSEIQVIGKHTDVKELRSYITKVALKQLLNPNTAEPVTDSTGRSDQNFILEVIVKRGNEIRRGTIQGRDGYAVTAPIIGEAVERLVTGKFREAGAKAPSEIFDAENFLTTLGAEINYKALAAV